MSSPAEFIDRLAKLGPGELSLLRQCADRALHERLPAFDLFTGLYWGVAGVGVPRDAAWLVAKLFAWNAHDEPQASLPAAVRRLASLPRQDFPRLEQRMEVLLSGTDVPREADLRDLIRRLERAGLGLDWAQLLLDLHQWTLPVENVPHRWAMTWLTARKGESHVG